MLLAIDTCADRCSVALLGGEGAGGARSESMLMTPKAGVKSRGHAESLFPMIMELMQAQAINWNALTAIGVTTGPGTFTGARIGIAAARGIGLARRIPVAGISCFDVMAHQATAIIGSGHSFLVALGGARLRGYARLFCRETSARRTSDQEHALVWANVSTILPQTCRFVVGDAAVQAAQNSNDTLKAVEDCMILDPIVLGILAQRRLQSDPNPASPLPLYLRAADATLPAAPPPILL